jgi:protein-S-isoprenylcysteine O-methyltransferase Ste14
MNTLIWLSFGFAASEFILMLIKRSKKVTSRARNDKGSLILLWGMITIGFTAGFILAGPLNQFWLGFGTGLLVIGIIIRWVAILQLGKAFTVDVAITDTARLKTDGIYERIRHPSYLGILMIVTGFSSAMNSIYSFLVLLVPVSIAILYRISVEEKVLIGEFGSNYIEYKKETKKIIPWIY